jgi:hypothetical protein
MGDEANCGSCGNACGTLEQCASGKCACAHTLCGGTCVSVDDDPKNCGTCGHDCGGPCVDGMCQPIILVDDKNLTSILVYQDKIYWLAGGSVESVKRADLDGTNVTSLATNVNFGGLSHPPVAANPTGFFWATDAQIFRIPLDGSTPPVSVVTEYVDGALLADMTVDASHLYWTTVDGFITRANLDGSGITVLAGNQSSPTSIVTNATSVYWANTGLMYGGPSSVMRVNLDGSNLTAIWTTQAYSVALTSTNAYWTDGTLIWSSDLDGRKPHPVAQGGGYRMSTDDSNLYWLGSFGNAGGIFRAPLAGGPSVQLVATSPISLTQDSKFLYYTWEPYSASTPTGVMRLAK